MAILHRADVRPTKLELIHDWLPRQPWYPGGADPQLRAVGAYRFDDPDGEVGVETHLVRIDDGPLLQVPLTYRGAPLPSREQWLVGTMEHSVLGRRWVYDACADPVYTATLAATILGGRAQAELLIDLDGRLERRTPTVSVRGAGSPGDALPVVEGVEHLSCSTDGDRTDIHSAGLALTVLRVVDTSVHGSDEHALTGTWADQVEPVLLATARRT